jgi:hypothetical protein
MIMKLFLSLTCFVFVVQTQAQNVKDPKEKLKFGISAGANFTKSPTLSYFKNAPGFKTYHKSRYGAGFAIKATMELFSSESKVSMQPEIGFALYNQKQVYKSSLNESADNAGSQNDKIKMNSITVGDVFKYNTKVLTIATGPQVDFLLSARIHNRFRVNSNAGNVGSESDIDFKKEKQMNAAMFSWMFGVERKIVKNWSAYLNYQFILTDATKYYINWQIGKTQGLNMVIACKL